MKILTLSFYLALCLALMLTACGGSPATPTASPAAQPQSTATARASVPTATATEPTEAVATATTPTQPTVTALPTSTELPPTATIPPVQPAANLKVVGQRAVELLDRSRILAISPNGKSLAAWSTERELCIHDAASLARKVCVGTQLNSIDLRSVIWSPDSSRVAFTENLFQYLNESDIHVLDVGSGKLRNLTDDKVAGSVLKPKPETGTAQFDAVPAWSQDGETIIFSRSPETRDSTALYAVPADGGPAKEVVTVTRKGPFAVWYGLRASPDGKSILYTRSFVKRGDPEDGLWTVDMDGRNHRQLLKATREKEIPELLGVSPEGTALVYYPAIAAQYVARWHDAFSIANLATGEEKRLKAPPRRPGEYFGPYGAILSPDVTKVFYTYRTADNKHQLAVRDLEGGPERILYTYQGEGYFGSYGGEALGLAWTDQDTLYVGTAPWSGILFTLGGK